LATSLALTIGLHIGPAAGQAAPAERAAEADDAKYPRQALTPQIFFDFLLAEMAAQRGQMTLAANTYIGLAKSTRDARIVQRAAEIAFHARQFDDALEMTRLWQTLDPESPKARQMVSSLLLASGRIEELAVSLSKELAAGGDKTGDALIALMRAFVRYPDRAAVQRLFDTLTAPYLAIPEARYVRALAAHSVRDFERANKEADAALALRPDWELAALLKAELLTRSPAQTEFLRGFSASHAEADDARLLLARALVNEKQYDAALKEFQALLLKYPNNPDVLYAVGILSLQLGDQKTAEDTLARFLQLGRGDLDAARYYLGLIADQAGRGDEALRRYGEVLAGEHVIPARIRQAQALQKQKKPDAAQAVLQAARKNLPDDARLIVAESQILRDTGRHKDAHALLHAALDKQPDQPELLYEAALAAEKLGDLGVMERRLRRLIEIKPDSSMAYNALGYSYADRNMRLEEASQLIEKALSLSPDDPFILDSKAWVLFRQGRGTDALEILKRIVTQRPDPEISAHLGEVLWTLGRRDEAVSIWRSAVKEHPDNEALTATIKRFAP
jgi:tetratricopeptide (TPR) repeat protein